MDRSGARLFLAVAPRAALAQRAQQLRGPSEWLLRTQQRAGPVGLGMAVVLAILFGFVLG